MEWVFLYIVLAVHVISQLKRVKPDASSEQAPHCLRI